MRFAHTNIAARDWKTLSDFYINVFDCTMVPPQRDLSGDWLDTGTGLTNAHLQGVHLALPGYDGPAPTLEIFSYDAMCEQPEIMPNCTGFTHIAFEVEDVDDILAKGLANGGSALGKVVEREYPNVGVLRFVYFRDPEGNIIEIQSWKKA